MHTQLTLFSLPSPQLSWYNLNADQRICPFNAKHFFNTLNPWILIKPINSLSHNIISRNVTLATLFFYYYFLFFCIFNYGYVCTHLPAHSTLGSVQLFPLWQNSNCILTHTQCTRVKCRYYARESARLQEVANYLEFCRRLEKFQLFSCSCELRCSSLHFYRKYRVYSVDLLLLLLFQL